MIKKKKIDNSSVRSKFSKLINEVNSRVLGMPEVIRGIILAMLSGGKEFGEHVFLLGAPGVGKSYCMDVIMRYFDIAEDELFDYLFHPFSEKAEILGEKDMPKFKKTGKLERNMQGFLPTAKFAIADEIWKSGPVTGVMMKITNERKFFDAGKIHECPLITMLAASNEYPSRAEDAPLWDRLLFKFKVEAPSWTLRERINAVSRVAWAPEFKITLRMLMKAKEEVFNVTVSADKEALLTTILRELSAIKIEVSPRRQGKLMEVARANAWLRGRTTVEDIDLSAIWPCCWNHDSEIPKVKRIINKLTNPTMDAAEREYERVYAAYHSDILPALSKVAAAEERGAGIAEFLDNSFLRTTERMSISLRKLKKLLKAAINDNSSNVAEMEVFVDSVSEWVEATIPFAEKAMELMSVPEV